MPTYYARASGSINGAIWSTSPTGTAGSVTFDPSDILVANGFNVSVNVNVTVAEIRADTTGGATAGGTYSLGAVTLTANVNGVGNTTNGMVQTTSNTTSTIVGNVTGGSTNVIRTMGINPTLNITGSLTGGTAGNCLNVEGLCVVSITGNVTGGSGATAAGVNNIISGAIITISGNVTGGSNSSAFGVNNQAAGTVNITGTVTGGTGAGVSSTSTGTVIVTGVVVGAAAVGLSQTGLGQSFVTRARGGPLTSSAVGVSNGTSGSTVTVDEIEYGDLGTSPTSGPVFMANKSTNVAVLYRVGLSKSTLIDVSSSLPAASNVRSGVSYAAGTRTGTMAVPPAASVANNVAVGSTTGTAFLDAADFWAYATSSATTSGSMGARLANAATVASTGQQLANALTP